MRSEKLESIKTAFGEGLAQVAEVNDRVVALVPDLTNSVGFGEMAEKFPKRFLQVGIAEQNIVCVASGLAHEGLIPFVGAYAMFNPGRNWEQIRTTVAMNNYPVKLVGSHAGLTVGPDGGTHQALEDIALMRVMPNMVVLAPADAVEAKQMAIAMARDKRPNYVRYPRSETPVIFDSTHKFEIGKIYTLREGSDVVVFTTGTMAPAVLEAAKALREYRINIKVVHCPTIKPLDTKALTKVTKGFDRVVTVEEHQIVGGFGSAICEALCTSGSCKEVLRIGVEDEFGQSGSPEELLDFYGLTPEKIAGRIKKFL